VKQQRSRHGESAPAVERARREFDVLTTLRLRMNAMVAEATAQVAYSVPRALQFDQSNASVIMDRARGKSLAELLRKARNRGAFRRVAMPLRRAGTWLRVMQREMTIEEDGRHLLTAIVVLALNDLELVCAASRRVRRARQSIIATLRRLEASVAARPCPVVGHHGDYWPGNIYIGARVVEVIDFEGFREGLAVEDAAYFLVHLRLCFGYPILRGAFEKLAARFLDGYFDGAPRDEDALRLFTLAKALQILAHGAGQAGARAQWRRRVLEGLIVGSLEA